MKLCIRSANSSLKVLLMAAAFTFLCVSLSAALPLTNTSVTHGPEWATFKVNNQTKNWYTDYYLQSKEFGPLGAFCVENVEVDSSKSYALTAVPDTEKMQQAAIVAGNFFYNESFSSAYSKSATQIAIWEIMFDTGLDLGVGLFQYHGTTYAADALSILDALKNNQLNVDFGPLMLAQSDGSQDFLVAAPVPEPASILLLGTGLIGLVQLSRKKFGAKQS